MSIVKISLRANAILIEYPTEYSRVYLLDSYLTASQTDGLVDIVTATGEYVLYKYPWQAVRDSTNTVFGINATASVAAINALFDSLEVDVATLENNFSILDSEALRNTSLITDLANVEKFIASTKGDYLLAVDAANPGGVKTVAPATFISNNSIVVNNSSPTFVTPTVTSSLYLDSSSTGIVFEGGTQDASETTLQAINPTADRTIYLPNASGTVALVGNNGEASFDAITFDLTPTTADGDGVMRYDPDYESLVFTTANGNKLVLGETYLPVINKTGTTIPLGSAVKATGIEGQRFTIALFDADVDNELYFIGLTEKAIPTESEGVVVSVGYVKGLNTSTYTPGTILYASGTPGGLTSTIPTKPAAQIVVCMVTTQSANGSVFVRPTIYHDLVESRDVNIPSPTAGVMIQRNAANTLWEKSPFSFPTADGTANQVLKTNGTGTLSWSTPATLDNTNVTLIDDREIDLNNYSFTIYNGSSVVAGFGENVQSLFGDVRVQSNNATPGKVTFYESTTGGSTNYVSLSAPASLSANTNYILPSADGSNGQVLSTNGSGSLSFITKKVTSVSGKTVATGAWSLVSGVYEASISDGAISASSIVDVIPNNADASVIRTAGLLPRTDSSAGAVKIYSTAAPTATITVTLNIFDL